MYILAFITPMGNTYFGMPDRCLKKLLSYQWEDKSRYKELFDWAVKEFSPMSPCDMPTADITVAIRKGMIEIRKLDMLRMGDILDRLNVMIGGGCEKEEVEGYFGWEVESILLREDGDDGCFVQIIFTNRIIIEAYREEMEGEEPPFCIFRIKKLTDLKGNLDYDINSIGLWIDLEEVEIGALFGTNGHFIPIVRDKCTPILSKFAGFFERDYFGIESRNGSVYIYYSLVGPESDEEEAKFTDVLFRFREIEEDLVSGSWKVLDEIEGWIPV
ncbi:MAG: hypothetical protein CW694_02400 [Candidatus Syntrophoarchaeum sp. WYZ-LMO15]|nr:MAG: hypothetical protein CW694_02400 [Candidatus Syntrophoarchaeum sp. WYZ-LMO15]